MFFVFVQYQYMITLICPCDRLAYTTMVAAHMCLHVIEVNLVIQENVPKF